MVGTMLNYYISGIMPSLIIRDKIVKNRSITCLILQMK